MRHYVRELSRNVHGVPNIFNFPDHCTATTTHPARLQTPTRRSYSGTQSSEEHRNRNPFSHIRVVASDVICGWIPDHCTATTTYPARLQRPIRRLYSVVGSSGHVTTPAPHAFSCVLFPSFLVHNTHHTNRLWDPSAFQSWVIFAIISILL